MAMTAAQQATWLEIVAAYDIWNVGDNALMPVCELDKHVEATSDQVSDTLTQAIADRLAEPGSDDDEPAFRPMRK